ncbi:MAG: DUF3997 domain-containing protein [Gemmataceae bacterium]
MPDQKRMTATRMWLACLLAAWAALIVSCGLLDYSYDVSGGYRVFRSSAHQVTIGPGSGWKGETPLRVPPKVVEIAWDNRFILAKQRHLRKRGDDGYEEPTWWGVSYWILDVKKPEGFGPLTAEEFAAKRAELGVSEELSLRDVTSFIPREADDGIANDFGRSLLFSAVLVPLGLSAVLLGLIALIDASAVFVKRAGGRGGRVLRGAMVAAALVGMFCLVLPEVIPWWVGTGAAAILATRGAVVCVRSLMASVAEVISSWVG